MSKTALPVITPRGIEINLDAGTPFEAVKVAREMLHTTRIAALATLDPGSGYPYNTVTNLAVLPDGSPLFFTSGLTLHARNMLTDPRISITLVPVTGADMMTVPRLSFVGKAIRLEGAEFEASRYRYLARYPKSKLYLSLPDTIMYRMEIAGVQINGGPTRNANDVAPADLRIDLEGADALVKAEAEQISRLTGLPETVEALARKAGGGEGKWSVTGIDPAGISLANREAFVRLWFTERVTSPEELARQLEA